jgi:hypothetical protein
MYHEYMLLLRLCTRILFIPFYLLVRVSFDVRLTSVVVE